MKSVSRLSDVEVYFAIRYLDPDWDNPLTVTSVHCVDSDLPGFQRTVEPAPLPAKQWIRVAAAMLVSTVVMVFIAVLKY